MRRRKAAGVVTPSISREELVSMHGALAALKSKPGSEVFSLMCSIAHCMNNWPRVREEKAQEVRDRFRAIQRDDRNNVLERPASRAAAQLDSPRQQEASSVPGRILEHAEQMKSLAAWLDKLKDLPDNTPVVALQGGTVPSGLTLGQLRNLP